MTTPDMEERLAELERLAKEAMAVPGPDDEDDWFMPEHFARLEPADAAFIAAAIPATILALLSERRKMVGAAVVIGEEGEVYTAAHLRDLLEERDRFIVSEGLWPKFCDSLPALTGSREP